MATRGPDAPRGRRIYYWGIGAIGQRPDGSFAWRTAPLAKRKTMPTYQRFAAYTMAMAAWFVKYCTAWERETAKILAGQSGYTWKDMLISMYFGTAVEFTDVDGNQWTGRRILSADIQAMLDAICSTPGAQLVRTSTGWACLLPGTDNYVMKMDPTTSMPNWLPEAGGGGGGGTNPNACKQIGWPEGLDYSVTTTPSIGFYRFKPIMLAAGQTLTGVFVHALSTAAACHATPVLYDLDATTHQPKNLLASGPTVVGIAAPGVSLPFTSPVTVATPTPCWLGWINTGASFTAPSIAATAYNKATSSDTPLNPISGLSFNSTQMAFNGY